MKRALAALFLVVSGACADDGDPRPATSAYIVPAIFVPSCATASCHSRLSETSDLVLEGDPETVARTLARKSFVNPGYPAQSPLVHLLRGDFTSLRMPPDLPLAEADIALIERWIEAGTP